MSRLSRVILLALPLLGGCVKAGPRVAAGETCGGCHAPHRLDRGACSSCHRGEPTAERQELGHRLLLSGRAAEHGQANAPAVVEGRRLVDVLACRRCHVVGGRGNRLAANLDRAVWRREQAALARSIGAPVENMPRFAMREPQVEATIAFLLHEGDPESGEESYRVRFWHRRQARSSPFEEDCGGCHRAILPEGPVGRGSVGPNLSGLFTPHYPATAAWRQPWTRAALEKWLTNPRALRPRTTMPPVRLERGDLRLLEEELGDPELDTGP